VLLSQRIEKIALVLPSTPAAPPIDQEVAKAAERIARRIERLMIRLGMTAQSGSEEDAEFGNEQPLFAELYGASIPRWVAMGFNDGLNANLGSAWVRIPLVERFRGRRRAPFRSW